MHFPTADDQFTAIGEWFERQFYPAGVRALATARSPMWREVRHLSTCHRNYSVTFLQRSRTLLPP